MEKTVQEGIKAVVFDLDGTLLDTLTDLANAVNAALSANGMPKRTIEEVRQFVGNGVRNLMIRAIPNGTENPAFEKTFADFKVYYEAHCKDYTKPYEGIMPLLEALKQQGFKMAIVSNKLDPAVKILAEDYFKGYFGAAIGEMEGVERKPAPDTVYKALNELGVSREEAIYVGDSDVDMMTARNAGLPCISVTWGFREEGFLRLHGATQFIHTPMELLEIL